MYTLNIRDEGSDEDVEFETEPTPGEITAACEEWVEGGDWGTDGAAIDVYWTLTDEDGDEIDSGSETVMVEPDHDALVSDAGAPTDCDHDWTSEGEGGLDENPGVWSTGGTSMVFHSHCRCCGLKKVEHWTGAQRNPGEHDTVSYEMATEEEIAQYRACGAMNEEVEA